MAAKKQTAKTTSSSNITKSSAPGKSSGSGTATQGQDAFDLLKAQHKDMRVRAQKLAKHLGKMGKAHSEGGQDSKSNQGGQTGSQAGKSGSQSNGSNGNGEQQPQGEMVLRELHELCAAWIRHAHLEEELVFPALEDAGVDTMLLDQAEVQRDLAILLLDDLVSRRDDDDLLHSEAAIFCEMVPRIARFEETKLLSAAKKAGMDQSELTRMLQSRMQDQDQAEENNDIPRPRHLRGVMSSSKEYVTMRGQDRDRDERGRFMDDDDRRGSRGGGRGGYSSRSSGRSSSSGRYDNDDNDGRGWHGDPRGHSEASRRGWEERRGSSSSRSRYDDDDDDRRSSSRGRSSSMSRSDSGRRTGGWFGDSEGHSEASRRGWENPDHGDSGWFGDREGHSQASRRGWQNPDHGDSGWFGDREGHSQASRRGWDNPNHGDSGWFGDPEGHSEASRKGWRTRRDDDDDYDDRRRSRRGRD